MSQHGGVTTLTFDIETSALEGDVGIILCASYKSSVDGKVQTIRTDKTNPRWYKGHRGNDKETVRQICEVLQSHDVLVAHNGTRFDLPFIRTRAMKWGLPRLPDQKIIDPLSIAWRKLRLKSNRLGNISDILGVKDRKTPLDMSVWMEAVQNGSKPAMDLIVEHCEADVKVLAAVLEQVKPYAKVLDDRGSAL